MELDWGTLSIGLTTFTFLALCVVFYRANSPARAKTMLTPKDHK